LGISSGGGGGRPKESALVGVGKNVATEVSGWAWIQRFALVQLGPAGQTGMETDKKSKQSVRKSLESQILS
jgi:hypothetical protein